MEVFPALSACSLFAGLTQDEIAAILPCPVSYTHLRAHETGRNLVCRLLLEKKKIKKRKKNKKKKQKKKKKTNKKKNNTTTTTRALHKRLENIVN